MSIQNWRGGKGLRGKETINHLRRKPQNCFYADHNDIGDEADNYYVYMMMVLTMMMTMMRMTLMEQRASKLADPQWGSVRRHFDHSITITPQNHNTHTNTNNLLCFISSYKTLHFLTL